MIKVTVKDKTRIIRKSQISLHTDHELHCRYKDHDVSIVEQQNGDFYVSVTDKTGMYAVQGGFGGSFCRNGITSINDCLVMAIENILI